MIGEGPYVPRTLVEACRCTQFWALTSHRRQGLDKREDDHVKKYEEWRKECPNYHKRNHAAFCERCDNSFPTEEGGANWLRNKGRIEINPFEKFPEPLKPRDDLGRSCPSVCLACKSLGHPQNVCRRVPIFGYTVIHCSLS